MVKNNWTKEKINEMIEILSRHYKVTDALNEFSKNNKRIKVRSLRDIFRTHGYEAPSHYLKNEPEINEQDIVDSRKEALIKKAEKQELENYRRKEAITDIICDRLSAEIYKLPKVKFDIKPKKNNSKEKPIDIMAVVSDCQIGTLVKKRDVGGLNEFSYDHFKTELVRWKDEIINFIARQLTVYKVDQVIINFLGDIVEGHDIFTGQAYHLDLNVYEQVVKGSHEFSKAIAEISASIPNIPIKLMGVGGNHGRVGKKGEAPNQVNWDIIFYQFLFYELHNYRKDNGGNVDIQWSEAWFQIIQSKGWLFFCIHGEDIRGWMGLPYYGVDRAKARYMEMINRYFTYMLLGHFHKEAEISSDNGEKIINGNWIGGTAGSKMWMGSNNPNQWIFTINEKYGICVREKIYLKTRHETKPNIKIYE